jgi:hypothetical protein
MMLQGFYSSKNPDREHISTVTEMLTPAFTTPAQVHGSAQFAPRSRFLGERVFILNFRLKSLDVDTGDIGRLLGSFAASFFGGTNRSLLNSENIEFDLDKGMLAHKKQMNKILRTFREAGCVCRIMVTFLTPTSS